MKSDVGHI